MQYKLKLRSSLQIFLWAASEDGYCEGRSIKALERRYTLLPLLLTPMYIHPYSHTTLQTYMLSCTFVRLQCLLKLNFTQWKGNALYFFTLIQTNLISLCYIVRVYILHKAKLRRNSIGDLNMGSYL